MNDGLKTVSAQTTADGALIPGTKANKALVDDARRLRRLLAGDEEGEGPPTARLKPFAASMTSACTHLANGAHGVANGVSTIYKQNNAKLGTLQIKAAFKEFTKGSGAARDRAPAAARDRRQGLQVVARSAPASAASPGVRTYA